jgi:hypothetical protein
MCSGLKPTACNIFNAITIQVWIDSITKIAFMKKFRAKKFGKCLLAFSSDLLHSCLLFKACKAIILPAALYMPESWSFAYLKNEERRRLKTVYLRDFLDINGRSIRNMVKIT